MSRRCPSLSPASVLELHSLHPLVSPPRSLSLSHFLQLGSVQEEDRNQIFVTISIRLGLSGETVLQTYLSQGPADFCHHTLDVFLGAAVLSQDPQRSPVDPE